MTPFPSEMTVFLEKCICPVEVLVTDYTMLKDTVKDQHIFMLRSMTPGTDDKQSRNHSGIS